MKRRGLSDSEKHRLSELKSQDPFTGVVVPLGGGGFCKVRVIGRGEIAFYQEGDRALFVEAIVSSGAIVSRSIRFWDTDEAVTKSERAAIAERVAKGLSLLGVLRVKLL